MALPFFAVGLFIGEHIESIKERLSYEALILCIVGGGISLLEGRYIKSDLYIGSIIASISLFLFCQLRNNTKKDIFSFIGDRLSMYIYILHLIVKPFLITTETVFPVIISVSAYLYLKPIIVMLLSTLLGYGYYYAVKGLPD